MPTRTRKTAEPATEPDTAAELRPAEVARAAVHQTVEREPLPAAQQLSGIAQAAANGEDFDTLIQRAEQPAPLPIARALAAVARDIGAVGKTGVNEQQHYRFRGIDALLDAAHPVFARHGVTMLPRMLQRDVMERTTKSGNAMTIVHLHVEYTFLGPAGDSTYCSVWGEGQDTADKATNKAMSAALKYALVQTLLIPLNDLDDGDSSTMERPAVAADNVQPVPKTIDDVLTQLDAAAAKLGKTREQLTAKWRETHGGISVEDLPSVNKAVLWGFVVSLAPYLAQAEREQEQLMLDASSPM